MVAGAARCAVAHTEGAGCPAAEMVDTATAAAAAAVDGADQTGRRCRWGRQEGRQ